ncbi:MAG: hypothetical protein RJA94_3368 [Pseudomonadota bacterium]|jgi:hypothetical protein
MRQTDHSPSLAAGHALIAAALGLSLLVIAGLMLTGH